MPSPLTTPVQEYLETLLESLAGVDDGELASYIPELALADPNLLGVALATVDGAVYLAGDHDVRFSIQSMSKPFTYGLALADRGTAIVDAHIGVEPTGDAFNSISLEPGTGRPRNPMINAGAIIATALVLDDRDERILEMYSACAGRPLEVDEAVFRSERETGHRNRAIGHMLRAVEILHEDPDPVLDAYFRQCAVSVDVRDVALMAATLANGGAHPITEQRVLDPGHIRRVLSVMTTCGMYDGAGDWLVGVGLPAKSGVAGGVMAVLPGQLGLCVFSPRLDALGNSVRGVQACRRISADLGLHSFDVARASHSSLRTRFDLTAVPSTRRRPVGERERLAEVGQRCVVYELQGDLVFGAVERVIRDIITESANLDLVVLDLLRTSMLDAAAERDIRALAATLTERGKSLVAVAPADRSPLTGVRTFSTLDPALEWCEWELLGVDRNARRAAATLAGHELTAHLTDAQRQKLAEVLETRAYSAGETLIRKGDAAEELYLLMSGEVGVFAGETRLSTLMPGSIFGETALVTNRLRSADVIAEQDGELLVLTVRNFERLGQTDTALQAELLRALLHTSHEIVVRLTRQLSALS